MYDITQAKNDLRVDGSDNDIIILSLCEALPDYIELQTGMSKQDQINEPLVDTVCGFIIRVWYYADKADDVKLQRTIDNLLKCITLKANAINRAAAETDAGV